MAKLSCILFCFIHLHLFAASTLFDTTIHLNQQDFIVGNYTDFYTDNLGNIYLVTDKNQVKKIDNKGDSVSVSNVQKKYGNISYADVSNPLKIALYYKDFSTIIILDRFLSNINIIDLRQYGILQANAIAQSYDNNYWVFDEVENKLKKIDDNGNVLLSTPDFRILFNDSFLPEKIIDYNGYVYLYNRENGWIIFDYYCAYKQRINFSDLRNVQVIQNDLVGFDSAGLMHRYNVKTFTQVDYNLGLASDKNQVIKMQLQLNNLYCLKNDGLYMYSFQK